jgi:alpha-galactosidase
MFSTRIVLPLVFVLTTTFAWSKDLSINGPETIGVVPEKPFLFLIPATGEGQITYSAKGLPQGLELDTKTGIVKGMTAAQGEFNVELTVTDSKNSVTKTVKLVSNPKALALTPPMGWNPWYVWGCTINDQKIRDAADLLVSTGLAAVGYNYINLDDCWQGKRDADGNMVPNEKFPDMKALADYVHSKGLRIGMYTGPGKTTCGGYQATEDLDYESGVSYLEKDVQLYAKWGFDFIKYDYCIFPRDPKVDQYYKSKQPALYQRMTDALAASSRAMVHMICQYGKNNVWDWAAAVGGNMWRTNDDLADTWPAVLRNGFGNIKYSSYAGPGHWNDLDMLIIGKANWPMKLGDYDIPGTEPRPTQLTKDEQLTHMTLWSMMASPLLFSSDLTQLDPWTLSLLTNTDMIAVNQDSLGAPVEKVWDGDKIVLKRPLADGRIAVAMFNLNSKEYNLAFTDKMIGLTGKTFTVKNVWTNEIMKDVSKVDVPVPAHGTWFGILTLN